MHAPPKLDLPIRKEVARLTQALTAVDSGDFFGAYTEAQIATMRTDLQRLRTQLHELKRKQASEPQASDPKNGET